MADSFLGGILDNVSGKSRRERKSRQFMNAGRQDSFSREEIQEQLKIERRKSNIRLLVALLIGLGISLLVYLILNYYGKI